MHQFILLCVIEFLKGEQFLFITCISYVISQVIYALHGFFFILFLGVEGLVKTFPNLFTLEKAQMVKDTYLNPKNLSIILFIEILAAVMGTLLGKYIYNKFFNRNIEQSGILS